MILNLERFAYTPMGTFGVLTMPEFRCYTVERPWEGNTPYVSCIPVGEYDLRESRFHRGGYDTYQLVDVPGRSLIKIHRANLSSDVQGCIGLGLSLGALDGEWAVFSSRKAHDQFMTICEAETPKRIQIFNAPVGGILEV